MHRIGSAENSSRWLNLNNDSIRIIHSTGSIGRDCSGNKESLSLTSLFSGTISREVTSYAVLNPDRVVRWNESVYDIKCIVLSLYKIWVWRIKDAWILTPRISFLPLVSHLWSAWKLLYQRHGVIEIWSPSNNFILRYWVSKSYTHIEGWAHRMMILFFNIIHSQELMVGSSTRN